MFLRSVAVGSLVGTTLALSLPDLADVVPDLQVSSDYNCSGQFIPVQITAQNLDIKVGVPNNQSELTGLETRLSSLMSNETELVGDRVEVQGTYNIWSYLCTPKNMRPNTPLQFAIHGINFDHTYWTFGGKGSKYNYAEAALQAGYPIFYFDRLGVGKSSKPDGIKEVQTFSEIEVAAALIDILREQGLHGMKFDQIVGVGHSFGSDLLSGIAATHGNLLNASVLTGFSTYTQGMPATSAAFRLTFAADQDAKRFSGLSKSYLATGGLYSDQLNFFYYPFFEPSVLQLAEDTKGTLTIGELLTQMSMPSLDYSNPVFIVTGDHDFIFCSGNCYQSFDGYSTIPAASQKVFPAVKDFSTYIPSGTGHAVNQHFSAPETYQVIQKWIQKRFA